MPEYVDIVDEDDNVIGKATRQHAKEKNLCYRASVVIVIDSGSDFLIQKRSSNKKIYADLWDIGTGETLRSGETFEQGALRGMKEEFGMDIPPKELKPLFRLMFRHKKSCRSYKVFLYRAGSKLMPEKIKFQKAEISEIKLISKARLMKIVGGIDFHPVAKVILERYLKNGQA